ncbi:unnamed protein product [Withania somnifera]
MRSRNLRCSMPSYTTYLKPGALAQIRNSRITAKSRVDNNNPPHTLISIYQQIPNSQVQVSLESIPCFNLKINNNRTCCLQRKKLSAVAPIFYEPNHDPSLVSI